MIKESYMIVCMKISQVWNKEEHARKLLSNRKDRSLESVNGKKQSTDCVSRTWNLMNRSKLRSVKFRVQIRCRLVVGSIQFQKNVASYRRALGVRQTARWRSYSYWNSQCIHFLTFILHPSSLRCDIIPRWSHSSLHENIFGSDACIIVFIGQFTRVTASVQSFVPKKCAFRPFTDGIWCFDRRFGPRPTQYHLY